MVSAAKVTFVLLLSVAVEVQSRRLGAPAAACSSLTPGHPDASARSDPPGGFFIYTELLNDGNAGAYTANTRYDVTLASPDGTQFLGFVIQARESGSTTLIGSFTVLDSESSQRLGCPNNGAATVTHTNNNPKTSISFEWTSPSSTGTVEFRYSIVTGFTQDYFANLNAADHRPGCPFPPTEFGDHALRFGQPAGCTGSECDYYVGLNQNDDDPTYLDVYLDGVTGGWVAIGFSLNRMMEEDDVLGCRLDSSSVNAVDTWNPAPRRTSNQADATQTDLCMHFGSSANGRISCSFSRLISGSDIGQDHNLNSSFYLMFGRRLTAQTTGNNLASHRADGINPVISEITYNPVLDEGDNMPMNNITCPTAPGPDAVYSFLVGNPGDAYYLTARVNSDNSSFLDVRMEANANGWVAIGFSDNRQMNSDDVLGCVRDSSNNGLVAVVDTYNPSTQYDSNQIDSDQSGVCSHTTDFSNGRVSCTFSRLIEPIDSSDRNLNVSWFLLFATSNDGGSRSSGLPRHSRTPGISESRANIVLDAGAQASDFPRIQLLKVHGILMIITWPLMVVTAIFFAAWMRPALPNGEWFQLHRIFMVAALFVGALGFIFAFVANADNSTPGLISFACTQNRAHFALGIIVFFLQIVNPLIAICRCNPTDKNRWIFNLTHGTLIGFIAELLALANVGIGIALFESGGCNTFNSDQYTILWVYISFVEFLLILQLVLFVVFTVIAFASEPEKRAGLAPTMLKYFLTFGTKKKEKEKPIEMTDPAAKEKPSNDPPPRKPPSKDAPIRWGGLAVFLPVTLAMLLAVIILVIIQ